MKSARLSVVAKSARPAGWHWGAAVLLCCLLTACANTPPVDETLDWSVDKIYKEAMGERNAGNFEKAVRLFDKLEGRAAGTPLAQQAQLEKAYAHYKASEQAQAIVTIDRFIKLHPASPALDYALFLKGLVNFNDNLGLFSSLSNQDLSERDQKSAKVSFEAFKELVERFPASKYAADAQNRMAYIVNSLAQSEIHVARYYMSKGAYLAAVNRVQQALTDYSGAPAHEEGLFILTQAYQALGLQDLRQDAFRVLEKNYPNSTYLGRNVTSKANPWWKPW